MAYDMFHSVEIGELDNGDFDWTIYDELGTPVCESSAAYDTEDQAIRHLVLFLEATQADPQSNIWDEAFVRSKLRA